jgi:hypothetical protein
MYALRVTGEHLIVGVNDKSQIVGVGSGRELESRLKVAADVIARYIEYEGSRTNDHTNLIIGRYQKIMLGQGIDCMS